ncbi:hypothetical protein L7F22_064934 [Adiantum nelumboides]|nr:hypothetical protein [Adiantum nelumboides]
MVKHRSKFIHWPCTTVELQQVKDGFKAKQGVSNCCGTLDVTSINMELPCKEAHVAWYNKNDNYSMTLQVVVYSKMRFLNVISRVFGVCNDIRILGNSQLHMKAQNKQILNGLAIQCADHCIREYKISDGGYMDLPWLVTPFPSTQLEEQTQNFNFKLSSTQIVVKRTFARLKQMWGYLHQRIKQPDIKLLPDIITACCILHNIWLQFGEMGTSNDETLLLDNVVSSDTIETRGASDTRDVLFS